MNRRIAADFVCRDSLRFLWGIPEIVGAVPKKKRLLGGIGVILLAYSFFLRYNEKKRKVGVHRWQNYISNTVLWVPVKLPRR